MNEDFRLQDLMETSMQEAHDLEMDGAEHLNLQHVGSMDKLRADARKVRFPQRSVTRETLSKIHVLVDESRGNDVMLFISSNVDSSALCIPVSSSVGYMQCPNWLHSVLLFDVNSPGREDNLAPLEFPLSILQYYLMLLLLLLLMLMLLMSPISSLMMHVEASFALRFYLCYHLCHCLC
jgi:hypothetical protein